MMVDIGRETGLVMADIGLEMMADIGLEMMADIGLEMMADIGLEMMADIGLEMMADIGLEMMADIGLETGLVMADIELDCIGLVTGPLDFLLMTGSETDNIGLHISDIQLDYYDMGQNQMAMMTADAGWR